VVDCAGQVGAPWPAEQILLIYADSEWIREKALSLSDVEVFTHDVHAREAAAARSLAESEQENRRLSEAKCTAILYSQSLEQAIAHKEHQLARQSARARTLAARVFVLEERLAKKVSTRAYRIGRSLAKRIRRRLSF